jgi:hypothetical protein
MSGTFLNLFLEEDFNEAGAVDLVGEKSEPTSKYE